MFAIAPSPHTHPSPQYVFSSSQERRIHEISFLRCPLGAGTTALAFLRDVASKDSRTDIKSCSLIYLSLYEPIK